MSDAREVELEALPAQYGFWANLNDGARPAIVGALGTGKTRAFLLKDLVLRLHNWQYRKRIDPSARWALPSMLVEPTYGMVRDILIPGIEEFLQQELGLAVEIRSPTGRPDIIWPPNCGGGRTMLRSAENPNRLAGPNLSHVGFDEPGQIDVDGISKGSARARHRHACCRQVFFTGSPEGINHFSERYDFPNTPDVTYWAREWHPSMKHYPSDLLRTFAHDAAQLDAYLHGMFVPMFTGRCYGPFDPTVHVTADAVYDPSLPIWLTCDFNVDHMRWLLGHCLPTEFRVFEEVAPGPGQDVTSCAVEVVRRYGRTEGLSGGRFGEIARHQGTLKITGDSTGSARSAHTGDSCYALLEREVAPAFRAVEIHLGRESNPAHRIRVDTVNWHLRGMGGMRVVISPKAGELIKDLVRERWVPGRAEIFQAQKGLEAARTHAAAAFGYWIWRLAPLAPPSAVHAHRTGIVMPAARREEW